MIQLYELEVIIKSIENGSEKLSIKIEGTALNERELIVNSIITLIKQITFREMYDNDFKDFDDDMEKILFAIAENYEATDIYSSLEDLIEVKHDLENKNKNMLTILKQVINRLEK
ncbi:hypothetical protein [Mesobacillus zeae]|uniref:hypothetical protein n=1 Tax=Mesobacillus zeae TaxID=1917180 RepID=UPI0030085F90